MKLAEITVALYYEMRPFKIIIVGVFFNVHLFLRDITK